MSALTTKAAFSPGTSDPLSLNVSDFDGRIASQVFLLSRDLDKKLETASENLLAQSSEFVARVENKITNRSFSAEPEVSGRTPIHGQSPPLRYTFSTAAHMGQFQCTVGGPMPSGSGFAHSNPGESLDRVLEVGKEPAQAQGISVGNSEVAQPPLALRRLSVSFATSAGPELGVQEPEDEDDRDSVEASPAADKTFDRLINFIHDQYDESRPLSDPLAPQRCTFEQYFVVADSQAVSRPRFRFYPRVGEIVMQSQDRADRLAWESKPLQRVIPLQHRLFPVADDPDYGAPQWLNPDFARLVGNKSIGNTRTGSVSFADMEGSVSFADMEKVELCSCTILAGHSQSFWLLSVLLSQVKQDGFKPSDPALFDKTISSLSATMATQTSLAAGLADFVICKHRGSYLAHVLFLLSESWKRELLVTPGSDASLFDQSLLEKVSVQVKEDSLISSSVPG